MPVLIEMSEITAQSCTLTTEEWKAEQQLERDVQAFPPVPVNTYEACTGAEKARVQV